MATNFPSGLDSFTKPLTTDPRSGATSLSTFYGNAVDSIAALETKVGINSSADTTSMDYKLSGVPASGKAASLTGAETLTNKIFTAPKINVGSDATGDMYYRDGSGNFQRLPIGSSSQIIQSTGIAPAWVPNPAAAVASFTVAGVKALDANAVYYGADSGTTNTYVITLSPALNAYSVGQVFTFKTSSANTGACTLNINGLGAKSIVKGVSTALASGDIANGQTVEVEYDGMNMVLQTPVSNLIGVPQYQKMSTIAFNAVSLTTGTLTSIADFTGLTGDTDDIYVIEWELTNISTGNVTLALRFNADTTSANYASITSRFTATYIGASIATGTNTYGVVCPNAVTPGNSGDIKIFAKTAGGGGIANRQYLSRVILGQEIDQVGGIWVNNSSQVTELTLLALQSSGSTQTLTGIATIYKINR